MKKYVAIGYFKNDKNKDIRFICDECPTIASFKEDLRGNGFVPWFSATEARFNDILSMSSHDREAVINKSVSSPNNAWEVLEFIGQCGDLVLEKFEHMDIWY